MARPSVVPPTHRRRGARCSGLAFLALLLLSGCTFTHRVEPNPDLKDLATPAAAPLRIGVYYSAEFREYEHIRTFGSHEYLAPIGASSVQMLDQVLPRLFAETVPVAWREPGPDGQRPVDAIIEPVIESFDFRLGLDKDSPRFGITYRFNAYDRAGTPAASWLVTGHGESSSDAFRPVYEHVGPDMRAAVSRLAAMFQPPEGGGESSFNRIRTRLATIRRIEPPPADRLSASAKPVQDPAEQTFLFGVPTAPLGIVTLRLRLQYQGLNPVEVLPWATQLVLPDGRTIAPAGASPVLSRLESPSHTGGAVAAAVGAPIGLFVTLAEQDSRSNGRLERAQSLEKHALQAVRLEGTEQAGGLLYFVPAASTAAFDAATLRLWFVNSEGEAYPVDVPVQGIGFIPPVRKT